MSYVENYAATKSGKQSKDIYVDPAAWHYSLSSRVCAAYHHFLASTSDIGGEKYLHRDWNALENGSACATEKIQTQWLTVEWSLSHNPFNSKFIMDLTTLRVKWCISHLGRIGRWIYRFTLTSSENKAAWVLRCAVGSPVWSFIDCRLSSIDLSTTPTQYEIISVLRFQFSAKICQYMNRQKLGMAYRQGFSTDTCTLHLEHSLSPFPPFLGHGIEHSCDSVAC
jgi:hypothetical protein